MLMPSGLSMWGSERLSIMSFLLTGWGAKKKKAVALLAICHNRMLRSSRKEKKNLNFTSYFRNEID